MEASKADVEVGENVDIVGSADLCGHDKGCGADGWQSRISIETVPSTVEVSDVGRLKMAEVGQSRTKPLAFTWHSGVGCRFQRPETDFGH